VSERAYKPYPIVLTQLSAVRTVVVGGGEVAARKVRALVESGANVIVISPELHPQLAALRDDGVIEHVARPYTKGDLKGAGLAFAATDRREVNALVADEARERGILLNVADAPDGSGFHTLGAVQRGDVLVAIGTGGESPALAALIRRKLEAAIGPEYGVLAERLGALRRKIGFSLPPAARADLWRSLTTDEALDLARKPDPAALDAFIEARVAEIVEQHALAS
jgi:precorrin-2 dehydrogenase / sirohydrochlorin ferrochelatase